MNVLSGFRRIRQLARVAAGHVDNALPLLIALALVFALVAVWWLGPQWIWRGDKPLASLSACWAVTVVLVLIPVVLWTWVTRKRYHQLAQQQRQQQAREADPLRAYEEAQENTLNATLGLLRQSLGRRDWLYRLPWYVVLGQENAGKTSFINRSNQSFALTRVANANRGSRRSEASLLNIDWWIGDDAVLIDPAGELICQQPRETKQDAAVAGAAAINDADNDKARARREIARHPELAERLWRNFVGWLGRNRSRRPLNGAILVVDMPTLLAGQASNRKALAGLIRARLRDLMEQLDTRLPIYIVLSKFDLVSGFDRYFEQLPRSVREDSLGFTCTLDSVRDFDAWARELSDRYDAFVGGLNERVFDAMAKAGQEEREAMFAFVRQLSGMKTALFTFLADIFESDRYSTPALVRGMYFTSVYQQGVPANTFVNVAAGAYAMPPMVARALPAGRAATYFTDNLFHRIVYPEAGLAGDNLRVLRRKRQLMIASSAVAALGCAVMIGSWQYYYTVNRDNAYQVLEKSRAFVGKTVDTHVDPTGRNLLQPLNGIRDAVSVFEDYRDAWPLVADLGLYQGRTIGPKVDAVYMRLLGQRYLPELAVGVMDQINATTPGSNERLAALRVYRMIEDRDNRKPPIVESWMARRWQADFAGDGATQEALMRHLQYAMKHVDTELPQSRALVAEVQAGLRQVPLAQRVYANMKDEARTVLPPPLDLRTEIGPGFDLLYRVPAPLLDASGAPTDNPLRIERLLTGKGFKDYFAANRKDLVPLAMIDQWTLGLRPDLKYSEEDQRELTAQVRGLYIADYIASWRQALNSLRVADFRDLDHGVAVLDNLTGSAEPLRRLVESVRANTTIYEPLTVGSKAAVAAAESKLMDDPDRQDARRIEREFAPLTQLLATQGDRPSYLDETRTTLGALHDTLKGVQTSPDRGQAALNVVVGRLRLEGTDPIFALQRVASGLPEPLNDQVGTLASESARVLMLEAMGELERRWDREVYGFYRERLAGRYPFNPASRQDVALEDFEAFFGPQGRLQQFHNQYLKLFLEDPTIATNTDRPAINPQLVRQLQAAQRIREAFFGNQGGLGLQFNVQPLALSGDDRSSVLNVDGQLVSYSHGPGASTGLIWPNTLRAGMESKLTVIDASGNSRALRYAGAWAWFRLLSQSQLNGATAQSVDLSFAVGNGQVRYRISTDKPVNPFTQRLFQDFALPRTLRAEAPTEATAAVAATPAQRGGDTAQRE